MRTVSGIGAVIDIGTNSVRLLVADISKKKVIPLIKETKVTRLGQGVDDNKLLDQNAMERTLDTLKELINLIPQGAPTSIVATSAVRDSKNKIEFARLILEQTGLPLQILSGVQEGKLAFKGAVFSLKSLEPTEPITVVDIGGGSTEIYTGTSQGKILAGGSLQLGAVRLLERFGKCNALMYEEIVTILNPLVEDNIRFKPQTLVAIGGTATSLGAIIQDLPQYSEEKVAGYSFSLVELEDSYAKLGRLSTEERRQIPSLQAGREDVIVYGTAILLEVMKLMGFSEIFLTIGDLLYGLLQNENLAIFDS